MSQLLDAEQTLFDLLASDEDGTPNDAYDVLVTRVYSPEPRSGDLALPIAITVQAESMDATTITLAVRVYARPDLSATGMRQSWLEAVDTTETLLAESAQFTRPEWSFDYVGELDTFAALGTVVCDRPDY